MTFETFSQLLSTFVSFLPKFLLLLILFLYAVFAGVVLRQVQLMNRVVTEVNFSPILFYVATLHFVATVIMFFLAVFLL